MDDNKKNWLALLLSPFLDVSRVLSPDRQGGVVLIGKLIDETSSPGTGKEGLIFH